MVKTKGDAQFVMDQNFEGVHKLKSSIKYLQKSKYWYLLDYAGVLKLGKYINR